VDGDAGDLAFRHADGTPYGELPSAASTELRAKAYRALTAMGYRETEAKRALARMPARPSANLEQLVRLALRELAPDATYPTRRCA
jgi:Holliday junction resolvasome RuvABC DNA-binding subunit